MKKKKSFKPSFLRVTRLSRNIDADKLCQETGIHPVTLRAMEIGYLGCGELNARRLGDFFGIDWRKFITKTAAVAE